MKPLTYDSPVVELHQRLFALLIQIEGLYAQGQAYYEFVERRGQPAVKIKLHNGNGFKEFELPLPTTEANFDNIDRRITKLIEAVEFENQRRLQRQRLALIKDLTPEQRHLLNVKEQGYEG